MQASHNKAPARKQGERVYLKWRLCETPRRYAVANDGEPRP